MTRWPRAAPGHSAAERTGVHPTRRDGIRRRLTSSAWGLAFALVAANAAEPQRPSPLRSGIEFSGADIRSMQADDLANPGMLWVARGSKLWSAPAGASGQSCAGCHDDAARSMRGVAARLPAIDETSGRAVNLEDRINLCRTRHQQTAPLAWESDDLLALTAYVAHQSRGMMSEQRPDARLAPYLQRGRSRYHQRIGQMNLACTHCHDRHWGRTLLAQTISQGHGHAYPAYRLEWQGVGSLQRRLRICHSGVRAQVPEFGSPELLDLEVYLAWRGRGLPVETPGVRR